MHECKKTSFPVSFTLYFLWHRQWWHMSMHDCKSVLVIILFNVVALKSYPLRVHSCFGLAWNCFTNLHSLSTLSRSANHRNLRFMLLYNSFNWSCNFCEDTDIRHYRCRPTNRQTGRRDLMSSHQFKQWQHVMAIIVLSHWDSSIKIDVFAVQ